MWPWHSTWNDFKMAFHLKLSRLNLSAVFIGSCSPGFRVSGMPLLLQRHVVFSVAVLEVYEFEFCWTVWPGIPFHRDIIVYEQTATVAHSARYINILTGSLIQDTIQGYKEKQAMITICHEVLNRDGAKANMQLNKKFAYISHALETHFICKNHLSNFHDVRAVGAEIYNSLMRACFFHIGIHTFSFF